MEREKDKPELSDKLGALQYAVWKNTSQNGKDYLNIEFTRSFRDTSTGEWRYERISLREQEVVVLNHLVGRCLAGLDARAKNQDKSART